MEELKNVCCEGKEGFVVVLLAFFFIKLGLRYLSFSVCFKNFISWLLFVRYSHKNIKTAIEKLASRFKFELF